MRTIYDREGNGRELIRVRVWLLVEGADEHQNGPGSRQCGWSRVVGDRRRARKEATRSSNPVAAGRVKG